ncbi:hypothetical protein ACFQ0B_57655 [Nonomuraea thailandensis]
MVPGQQELLRDHPGVLALALTKPPKGATALAIREQVEQLSDGGLEAAGEAVRALRAFVFGSVAVEVQQSGWADPEVDEWVRRDERADLDFERGLDALLKGLQT